MAKSGQGRDLHMPSTMNLLIFGMEDDLQDKKKGKHQCSVCHKTSNS